jgi:hypothetical protein
MPTFTLDVRRARKGDCLLLHFGDKQNPRLALIDAGPANVYQPQLLPRLQTLRTARGLPPSQGLPIDLLMVSHVDDDHIHGVLELTAALGEAQDQHQPLPFRVMRLWHNSFDEILGKDPKELRASITAGFGAAAVDGQVPDRPDIDLDLLKILASVGQGHQLRTDAKKLALKLNGDFGGKLAMATGDKQAVKSVDGLTITVLGPMKAELQALQKDHDAWLAALIKAGKSPTSALAAYSDDSVANLSSIVVLVEHGGKRMLLTGDARGDKVLEGLKKAGLAGSDGKITVDILKCPHHGSDRNVDPDFFQKIKARHYVFSGNGEHGNPERTTLQMLLDARGQDEFDVHFTYPLPEIDAGRKADRLKSKKKWSAASDGLVAWEKKVMAAGARFRIHVVPDGARHVIDLLDPLVS